MKKVITTGIASFGMSGKVFHAPLLQAHSGFHLKTIVERSKDEAHSIYPSVKVVRSFDELLNDAEIDLIIINTPDHTHYEYTLKALEAGKHVITEKPFTQKASQAEELISLASRKGKLLSVFQNRRWDGDFLTVKEIINKQLLGRLVEFEAHFERYRNYIQPNTWKENAETGTGTLYNLGSHLIDQALVLFGLPIGVFADIRILRTNGTVDDFFEVILFYENMHAALKASYLVREPGPHFILNGTLGSFVKYGLDPQEEALKKGQLPGEQAWGIEREENRGLLHTDINEAPCYKKIETIPGNYLSFYDNIYDVLVHGKELSVKPTEALNVIRIIEAAYQSNKEGRKILITQ